MNNNVLCGVNDWLFLFQGNQHQFDYLTGKCLPNAKSIENFTSNIEDRSDYCKNSGILYKHIVFPSKPLIMRKYLPEHLSNVKSLYNSHYSVNNSSVLYPEKELFEMEESHTTFYKYDTHNTNFGYLAIFNSILDSLGFKSGIENDELMISTKYVSGDLAKMCNKEVENQEVFLDINDDLTYQIGNKAFLPGNSNDVLITSALKPKYNQRVLIFGDSFFKGLMRFFRPLFSDVMYVRSSFFHKDIIENFKPHIVLTGSAERYLSYVKSDRNANNFLLELYGLPNYNPSEKYLKAFNAQLSFGYYNQIYKNWKKNIEADLYRDMALFYEKNNDFHTAYNFMKKALELRPNGQIIREKILQYSLLSNI